MLLYNLTGEEQYRKAVEVLMYMMCINTGVAVQPDGRGAVQEGCGGHNAGLVPWRLAPLQPQGPRLPPAMGLAAIRLSVGYMWSPLHPVSWLHDGGHPCRLVT